MKIYNVTDPEFTKYGKIIDNVDFSEIIATLENDIELPAEGVEYVPGCEALEKLPAYQEISTKTYGEMPIQIGYCNGHNEMLNALEYHRDSEINICATDAIFMLGSQQDITKDNTYDTSLVEAFFAPKGTAVEFYATTLHYAPCGVKGAGFKVGVVLPKGTNLPLDCKHAEGEDALITAKNKWLIGHAEGGLDAGAHIGLIGKNLNVNE